MLMIYWLSVLIRMKYSQEQGSVLFFMGLYRMECGTDATY
jgi:hypothetical protein